MANCIIINIRILVAKDIMVKDIMVKDIYQESMVKDIIQGIPKNLTPFLIFIPMV